MKRSILFLFSISIALFSFAQKVIINEISVCNVSVDLDPKYDYNGWIEIYNGGTSSIDLKNYYFSDSSTIAKRYHLSSSRIIPAGGFGIVWINDEIKDGLGGFLDTDPDGGFLSIADSKGIVLDKITYKKQYTNVSYGRITDGAAVWAYKLKPSCGTSNNGIGSAVSVVSAPVFSVSGGFFDTPLSVEIYCPTPGARIYYTLDATDPDSTKTLYNGTAININSTTPLRAKAYASGYLDGVITTSTYLINERKPDLPVAFLTTDPNNLYNDTTGIYCIGTNGIKITSAGDTANYNQDWTRLAHFEYLNENKELCLSQSVGISISGNYSRNYPLKSFEVKASGKYGVSRFDYPFFKDKISRRFKTLIFRNGGQQNIPGFMFKDAFNQRLVDAINLDFQGYEPCVVYLNGKYWGLMPIREKSSKDYVYSNYNYDKTEIDLIDQSIPLVGNLLKEDTLKSLIINNNIANDSVYALVRKRMDVDNYIRYMCAEIFLTNTDWPSNNMRRFVPKSVNGKFRWIVQDMDKGFTYSSKNLLKTLTESSATTFNVKMITYLLNNTTFREQFINTQCIVAGSIYSSERTTKYLDEMISEISKEFPYHAERWDAGWIALHNQGISDLRKNFVVFKNKVYNDLQTNFGLTSPLDLYISSSESAASIMFNHQEIPVLPYNGKYFQQKALILQAPEFVNGKKFKNWEIVENGITRYVDSISFTLSLAVATQVKAVYAISSLVRRKGLYINEISANNYIYTDNNFKYEDWIELYNDSDQPVALNNYFITNDESNLEKFMFTTQADTIPPFGYSIVWCSAKTPRGGMHTNFKLEKENGKIILAQQTETGTQVVDSMTYYQHTKRTSFGRCPDGSDKLMWLDQPTFKKHNLSSTYNQLSFVQKYDMVSESKTVETTAHLRFIQSANMLTFEKTVQQPMQVSIYTVTGVLLKGWNVADQSYTFSTLGVPTGIYIVKMTCGNENNTTKIIL